MLNIKLAGLDIAIDNRYKYLEKLCAGYICESGHADITVSATEDEICAQRDISVTDFTDGYLESVCVYRKICRALPLFDRLMLHSSVVEADGRAIALCGKHGTGKTTQTRLLTEAFPDVRVINGDKPVLHIQNECATAYGTPWRGEECLGSNISAPLSSVCFIEQADRNELVLIDRNEAAALLFGQLITPCEPKAAFKHLELADRLLKTCDFYKMYCTEDYSASALLYNTLFREEKI